MKTVKTILVMVIAIFAINFSFASGNLRTNIMAMEDNSSILKVSDLSMKKFEIKLRDSENRLIYSKTTKEPANIYFGKFNFSNLENGYYTVTVTTDTERNESRILLNSGEAEIVSERKIVQPFFSFKENRLKFSYLNFTGEEATLHIYNGSNQIYKKQIDNNFSMTHGVNLSRLSKGNYTVVLTHGDEVFEHTVQIR